MIDPLRHDVRFAWRQLRRAPAFAATAIVTLALGIGANVGIFSVINGFLRPLPVSDPDRVVVLAADVAGDDAGLRYAFSYPALRDYREQARVFSDVFAFDLRIGGLTVDGRTTQFLYHAVSGNFFTGLGLSPAAGRLLQPGEGEQLGSEPVLILSYAYWQRRFGGYGDVVGTTVRLDGRTVRVIGVAPEGFHGLFNGTTMDGYVPLAGLEAGGGDTERLFEDRARSHLTVVARLAPGVTLAEAQTAVDVVARRLESQYPETEKGTRVRVVPEPQARPLPLRFFASVLPAIRTLLFLLATFVLLLACLNVTNLLFVRASARAREMAVRTALGSGRGRLVRLLLVESLMIAVAGVALGLLLGQGAGQLLLASLDLAVDLPMRLDFGFDWPVLRYALAVALLSGVAVGLAPALRASRARMTEVLHDGGRGETAGVRRQRVRHALVVAQVAGSLVLLVAASFFMRSLQHAQRIDLGFDPANVLTMRLDPSYVGYDRARASAFYDELERRVRALPGVDRAAYSFLVPMGYIFGGCPVEPEGATATDEMRRPIVAYNSVGTDYFSTLRIPLASGRAFGVEDTAASKPVVVVNETLASRLWPGQEPIGRRMFVRCATQEVAWQVVGVARDARYIAVFEQPQTYLYVPIAQTQPTMRVLQLRSALPPDELAGRVRQQIDALDPEIAVADVRTMRATIRGSLGHVMFRVGAAQAGALGVVGLLLAVVGVYGVAAYGASQRVREIGIRLALGAQPVDVRRLVLGQGVRLVAIGIGVGLAVSAIVTTTLTRFLVLVSATDPATFTAATTVLVAIALLACYLPARKAMRVDPMAALRHE